MVRTMDSSRRDHGGDSDDADVVDPLMIPGVVTHQFSNPRGLGRVALGALAIGVMLGAHMVGGVYAWTAGNMAAVSNAWWLCEEAASLCVPNCRCNGACTLLLSWFTTFWSSQSLRFTSQAQSHSNVSATSSRCCSCHLLTLVLVAAAFLLFHSREYLIALVLAWVEYGLELWLAPEIKGYAPCICIGMVVVGLGQFFRTAAMWTAGQNFSHIIADQRKDSHRLVTTGVYKCVSLARVWASARLTMWLLLGAGCCATLPTLAGFGGPSAPKCSCQIRCAL